MISILDVAGAFDDGRRLFRKLMETSSFPVFRAEEMYGEPKDGNIIAQGDNLDYMMYLLKERNMAGKLQLIYVDPPFFSKGQYQASFRLKSEILGKSSLMKAGAYDDRWNRGMAEYLAMLTARLFAMRELLADTGCICVHLDWHVVHYVKLLMDQIFGEKQFINEVIWTYKSGGAAQRSFAKKHDTLLLYGRTDRYTFHPLKEKSYNRDFKPYRFQGVEEFQDERGWYTLVNMKDVWNIDMVGRTSAERTGYATQKPEKLLERIVTACSSEGDLCADFFAGSGTLGAVCTRLGRRWLLCDLGFLSAAEQIHRMGASGSAFQVERVMPCEETKNIAASERQSSALATYAVVKNRVVLLRYRGSVPKGPVQFREEMERYLSEDSLSMIKSWSVDEAWDGQIHRASSVLKDGRQEWKLQGCHGTQRLHVMGYDVLGNRFIGERED